MVNYDGVDGGGSRTNGSDSHFASLGSLGPDMLHWYFGIYLTFIDNSSKSLVG